MVSTALSSRKDMDHLRSFCDLGYSQNYFVHFDPAVNRALKYALAEKLVYQQRNTFFRLADKGKLFVQAIEVDQTVLAKEKRLLDELSRNLSEDKIKTLVEDWGRFDAKN